MLNGDLTAQERPVLPTSLRAFIVEGLGWVAVPGNIEPDTRMKAARNGRPRRELLWGGAPKRKLTAREMAYVTLLMGLKPDLPNALLQPEDVIRREAKAIGEILRRRRPEHDRTPHAAKATGGGM